jgi:hypothetical protein
MHLQTEDSCQIEALADCFFYAGYKLMLARHKDFSYQYWLFHEFSPAEGGIVYKVDVSIN